MKNIIQLVKNLERSDLTKKKEVLQNKELNIVGERLLKVVLFTQNKDLISNNAYENKRAYATAIEAAIGFMSIIDKKAYLKISIRSVYLTNKRRFLWAIGGKKIQRG